jgi:hypothetical protein
MRIQPPTTSMRLSTANSKKNNVGLVNTMKHIANGIKANSKFEDFEYIEQIVKRQIGYYEGKTQPHLDHPDKPESHLEEMYQNNCSTIHGKIIYEEFIKEYIAIFEAKKYIIDMMREFEQVKNMDSVLDIAINKLKQPQQI